MEFKKLKLATGITGLVGVVLAVACYVLSIVIANKANAGGQDNGLDMLGIVFVFIAFGIPYGIAAVIGLVFSILYLTTKTEKPAFYVVGAVLCIFDLFICFVLSYFAIIITQAFGLSLVALINGVCILLVVAAIVLKILCAVRIKKNKE